MESIEERDEVEAEEELELVDELRERRRPLFLSLAPSLRRADRGSEEGHGHLLLLLLLLLPLLLSLFRFRLLRESPICSICLPWYRACSSIHCAWARACSSTILPYRRACSLICSPNFWARAPSSLIQLKGPLPAPLQGAPGQDGAFRGRGRLWERQPQGQ